MDLRESIRREKKEREREKNLVGGMNVAFEGVEIRWKKKREEREKTKRDLARGGGEYG